MDLSEFQASLVYIASSMATQSDPVSTNTTEQSHLISKTADLHNRLLIKRKLLSRIDFQLLETAISIPGGQIH